MFRGNHPTRVDEKGRLKVPSEHKRTADEAFGGGSFYITSQDGERAEIYPMKQWEAIEEALGKKSSSAAKQKFLDVTGYYGQQVEMDAQGRLLIPQLLRERAGLVGDVAVVGQLTKLVVTNVVRYEAKLAAAPMTDADRDALALEGL